MGTEYYIVNKKDKTFYNLGKGGWYELNYDKEAFQDLEYLALFIFEDCYDLNVGFYSQEEIEKIRKYVQERVAPDLFIMMKDCSPADIEVFNDCGDDSVIIRSKGYRCIGSRYFDIGTNEYNEHIDFCNRHLKDTPEIKRRYNPENFKNLPEFDKY